MSDKYNFIEYQYSESPDGPWQDDFVRKTNGPARDWSVPFTSGMLAADRRYVRSRVRVFVAEESVTAPRVSGLLQFEDDVAALRRFIQATGLAAPRAREALHRLDRFRQMLVRQMLEGAD